MKLFKLLGLFLFCFQLTADTKAYARGGYFSETQLAAISQVKQLKVIPVEALIRNDRNNAESVVLVGIPSDVDAASIPYIKLLTNCFSSVGGQCSSLSNNEKQKNILDTIRNETKVTPIDGGMDTGYPARGLRGFDKFLLKSTLKAIDRFLNATMKLGTAFMTFLYTPTRSTVEKDNPLRSIDACKSMLAHCCGVDPVDLPGAGHSFCSIGCSTQAMGCVDQVLSNTTQSSCFSSLANLNAKFTKSELYAPTVAGLVAIGAFSLQKGLRYAFYTQPEQVNRKIADTIQKQLKAQNTEQMIVVVHSENLSEIRKLLEKDGFHKYSNIDPHSHRSASLQLKLK